MNETQNYQIEQELNLLVDFICVCLHAWGYESLDEKVKITVFGSRDGWDLVRNLFGLVHVRIWDFNVMK